ncbi:retrovirus-related pol polyprotein from transposon TNT 1-94 [Tanacetum coccineum]
MANLKYSDKHNMVAFLKKPNESVGFTKVVDFLKGTSLRYALTHNPTIYDSLVKQFWQTATVRTLANGTQQLVASIDSKEYIITEASVRSKLQLADATGIHNLSDAEIYAGLATLGKRGYAGDIVPLLPVMLAGAAMDQGKGSVQPAEPHHTHVDPIPSTSQPPHPSSPHPSPPHPSPPHPSPLHHSPPHSLPHSPPQSPPYFSPPKSYKAPLPEGNTPGSVEDSIQLKELMVLLLKRKSKKALISESEGEEPEDQGRKIQDIDDDPLVSLVRESMKENSNRLCTPYKKLQGRLKRRICPTILEAAKTLSKVASQGVSKEKLADKGKRYRRRARSIAKKIDIGLDAEKEINTGREEINTGIEELSTGSTKVDSGTASKRGQREGKAPMVEKDIQTTHKTKEQIRQEEARLEEAIKLQAQLDKEVAKQIHLDKMIAKRMAEKETLTEQQKKRKAQVQFEAQFYTKEDWDAIRAKLEANAELSKDVLGQDLPKQDFAKRMVDMVNQRKKHFAEERAKAKRNKPMTQSQLRIYMSNYLKNQGTWKLSQLKKLKFEEIKEEFDKLVQQIDTFVPINLKITKAKLKKYGEVIQTKTSKKQKIDDKDVPAIGEKVAEVKEEEQVKRTGKRKKQNARKEAMNPTPLTTKSDSVANWKIFQQGQRSVYQIIRANGADTVYMSFGAMIKDFTREDLIELYILVMQKYGINRPEDAYNRVLWSDLKTMFDPPLIEDAIWSLPLQQKMVSWRYYDKCEVHCLTLEACTIYMLADRKYPLSKEACQVMLKMKLLDGKMNEVCYKLLKMIEKQAGIRKFKDLSKATNPLQAKEPKNVNEALGDKSWIVAMQEELNQFIANDVWELVPQPRNMKIIGTKWVFRNKLDENGIVSRNKARLVAQGYNQQKGIDYDETYTSVARLESIRILLAYACALDFKLFQMDVKSAFLNGFINEEVYGAQPPGFIDFEKQDHVYKLKKALYGLKQAPKAWYDRLKDFLIKHEYKMGMVDNTLFTKKKSSNLIIVQIYVDDVIFGSTCQDMCDEIAKIMHDEFEMSMMGELNFFLGLQIKQMEDGIFFNQSKYIKEMLKKFGLEDSKPMENPHVFRY